MVFNSVYAGAIFRNQSVSSRTEIDGPVRLLLNPPKSEQSELLNSQFTELNSVTEALQQDNRMLADVRV